MIKSISFSQEEILQSILTLYVKEDRFHLDPTFSKGVFYKHSQEPIIKGDIHPQSDTIPLDCRYLPFKDNSIRSIVFDPPFVIGKPNSSKDTVGSNLIYNRFSGFASMKELAGMYWDSLTEFYRVLKPDGILVFKCQDTVSSGKQYMTHCFVWDMATDIGFRTQDLFILLAKSRLMSGKWKEQRHARKFHSYFWVFKKEE